MLTISPVSVKNQYNFNQSKRVNHNNCNMISYDTFVKNSNINKTKEHISFQRRLVGDVEYEQYLKMSEEQKEFYRYNHKNFYKLINIDELFFPKKYPSNALPLSLDNDMKNFLGVASAYNKYRGNKIICVGRSPKWFLNTSMWMKNGIEDYSMAAFSSNWYHRDHQGVGPNLYRDNNKVPTDNQTASYRRYTKKIKCDPVSIVQKANRLGKPVIITDYIHSGSGLTSYLDLMSKFAEDAGVLDDFAKSIELFTMGSVEYLDDLGYCCWYSLPKVLMPERLSGYDIPQHYHDMSANVLERILIEKNTNECRSTYYPPAAWTVYNPMKYKTGLIPDERLKEMPRIRDGVVNNYTDAMKDYRNLMNFRILDYLYQNNLLKDKHKTR